MELVNFSVTNFRSITKAHKVILSTATILIGKNNEGKSNLLKALDVAMTALQRHASERRRETLSFQRRVSRQDESMFNWERDFPIALQNRKTGTQTNIRLEFSLNKKEIAEFKEQINSNLNGSLPILIKIGKDNRALIQVSKKGKGAKTLNSKSNEIAYFIANKILFNYIPAIRTDQEALDVVRRTVSQSLSILEDQEEYKQAIQTILDLQKPIFEKLSNKIKEPLSEFLPGIKSVTIETSEQYRRLPFRQEFEIVIDDGTPTNLAYKGDGVKSLAALGLLKNRMKNSGASIVAIEEPESHLHPEAIHQLNEIIKSLSNDNQVILTTHNPLFVDRKNVKANVIINSGKASPAKDIRQIRELLGIKASDNLMNANYTLVVEGQNDANILKKLISLNSEPLAKLFQFKE